jgi:hypothetical protein
MRLWGVWRELLGAGGGVGGSDVVAFDSSPFLLVFLSFLRLRIFLRLDFAAWSWLGMDVGILAFGISGPLFSSLTFFLSSWFDFFSKHGADLFAICSIAHQHSAWQVSLFFLL